MRTEVAFFSRVIFGIDENSVVRAGGHAGFTADADRFIEINDAVGTLEHSRCGTRGHARRVRALIAARYLVGAAHLWEDADVNMLDVGPSNSDRHNVLRLASGRARMATDTAGVIDDLRPLHLVASSYLMLDHFACWKLREYITEDRAQPSIPTGKAWKGVAFRTLELGTGNGELSQRKALEQLLSPATLPGQENR